jgi:hypothetical protein
MNAPKLSLIDTVGDKVMIQNLNPTGLDARGLGPFIITQVQVNGTMTIKCLANLFEHVNICHLHPYHQQ